MKAKGALTVGLLLFVAGSVAALVVKQSRQPAPTAPGSGNALSAAGQRVIAYYFHGNVRCPTCQSIEAYAHEALQSGFAEQFSSGRLQWQIVNYEEPANEHFAVDYQLVAPSLVLVRMDGSVQKQWKNLPEVWELVGDKKAFVEFVQSNVRAFLEGSAAK